MFFLVFSSRDSSPPKTWPNWDNPILLCTYHPLTHRPSMPQHLITSTLRQIYLHGTHGEGRYIKAKLGQPRLVAAITGGGGSLFAKMFGVAGASSTILEAIVPYSKNSCLDVLHRQNQTAEGIGFCSEEMAWRLATASRDRALELESDLNRWPDVHGLGCTATIVSHYQRRGGYRVHAAAVNASGRGSTYTHEMVKGARNRQGEDLSCALLAARAFADSANVKYDETVGVRTSSTEANELGGLAQNEVGEIAEGVEVIPARVERGEDPKDTGESYVFAGRGDPHKNMGHGPRNVCAPKGHLPKDSVVVWCKNSDTTSVQYAASLAQQALALLGRQGDGQSNTHSVMPAPVFVVSDGRTTTTAVEKMHKLSQEILENVGVMVMAQEENEEDGGNTLASCARAYPKATYVMEYTSDDTEYSHARLLDDGSPSTVGIGGVYVGTVRASDTAKDAVPLPHGHGVMTWDNGISYQGSFCHGLYHGFGSKLYSKGGGYVGSWHLGKREGLGISLFEGKWGYEQWSGNFVKDLPHGMGIMDPINDGAPFPFEFKHGEPVLDPVVEL
jgi:hypothetical protein